MGSAYRVQSDQLGSVWQAHPCHFSSVGRVKLDQIGSVWRAQPCHFGSVRRVRPDRMNSVRGVPPCHLCSVWSQAWPSGLSLESPASPATLSPESLVTLVRSWESGIWFSLESQAWPAGFSLQSPALSLWFSQYGQALSGGLTLESPDPVTGLVWRVRPDLFKCDQPTESSLTS